MCLCAHEAHLANTKIFTCVCKKEDGKPTRQLTIYKNDVSITNSAHKQNFMCLPIPLQSGLVPKEHISLYNFNSKDKGALEHSYENFFDIVDTRFESQRSATLTLSRSASSSSEKPEKLEVQRVGNFNCSLAANPGDVLRLDESVFGKIDGLKEVLEKNYATDFAFLICVFAQDTGFFSSLFGKKTLHPHPLAYSHPIAKDGKLFIPTMHYHGGEPNHAFVNDWDHNIFVVNGDIDDVDKTIANAKHVKGSLPVVGQISKYSGDAGKDVEVIKNLLTQHSTDNLEPFSWTIGFKLQVHGTFDNIDFTPAVTAA